MIIWVNGGFGSGKTTLVDELAQRWQEALVYDPEQVGYLLQEIVGSPTGNFQDLALWRQQAASLAMGLVTEYGRPVLVPMTLVDAGYVREIHGALADAGITVQHFFLKVPRAVLEQRIDGRTVAPGDPEQSERARLWCREQIDSALAAPGVLPGGTVYLDGELTTAELADQVLARVHAGAGAAASGLSGMSG
ncbi:AAA family ATPase [Streptomyces clavuligerus]|uniref:AAA family ATPase n=1 Tax=Streptomyces clavuligerus TaxID=1901 RepID=UPI00017FF3B1|nr:AAA family ATPase [Streptomyces clavuligerus]ANW22252.1 TmrB-like protein [Streptomyces clavuligerus]AXU17147.1 TmrB-like protein [Streptomyces clavuligerus]EDY47687.1 conserved hypothetical protein [Streptomyces clavuligerus]MBY6307206.1 AAA family ATPase [Streptomyces clavuligerus]QCS10215.1 TmrB-like protein [Streptomyces clavuligerus]